MARIITRKDDENWIIPIDESQEVTFSDTKIFITTTVEYEKHKFKATMIHEYDKDLYEYKEV